MGRECFPPLSPSPLSVPMLNGCRLLSPLHEFAISLKITNSSFRPPPLPARGNRHGRNFIPARPFEGFARVLPLDFFLFLRRAGGSQGRAARTDASPSVDINRSCSSFPRYLLALTDRPDSSFVHTRLSAVPFNSVLNARSILPPAFNSGIGARESRVFPTTQLTTSNVQKPARSASPTHCPVTNRCPMNTLFQKYASCHRQTSPTIIVSSLPGLHSIMALPLLLPLPT